MEILLLCAIAFAAGQRSEQTSLGISPADRAMVKEHRRHEKSVRRIAEKHGTLPPEPTPLPGASPWKEPAPGASDPAVPETFRSGYRSYVPVPRTATPMGRRAGSWTARGVAWAKDTGRSAVREYRKRRQAAGEPDPAPVLTPPEALPMPEHPPMPAVPPSAGAGDGEQAGPEPGPEREGGGEWDWLYGGLDAVEPPDWHTEAAEDPVSVPVPRAPETVPDSAGVGISKTTTTTTDTRNGVGRMAAEVTYESVMDESDELSLMCDEDVKVYGRIGQRCEREIGRADALIADARNAGVGGSVIGWISRALEKYQGIHSGLDELTENTVAQGEAVVKAKELLRVGQGLYADIAQDMEDVADREFYVSDAVDSEDTDAHTETFETRGA